MTRILIATKNFIKKVIPKRLFDALIPFYHFALAKLAAIYYNNPSEKMIVIGITGTKGKSSVANFIWSCLQAAGHKTGLLSTAIIRIGEIELPNNYHMTMPGRFTLQKLLRDMFNSGCKFAVVETTSEGIKQWRHVGIDYDYAIFTNLYPEHLTSHGNSFEEYKKVKGKLFMTLKENGKKTKTLDGKTILKTSIVNNDSPYGEYFRAFDADKKFTYGLGSPADFQATKIETTETGSRFIVNGNQYEIKIPGTFNVENSLPAIVLCKTLDISPATTALGFSNLKNIPGRMEPIDLGQKFKVYVDYAHQKESMEALLRTARNIVQRTELLTRSDANSPTGQVIVILGAEGGGRDKAKRPAMGEIAGKLADYVVLTNVDPYDDDPQEIIEDIAKASEAEGKIRGKDLFTIEDRRMAIRKALNLAKENDLVLITGKGSEQSMIVKGVSLAWDDRVVVREEIRRLKDF